MKIFLSLLLREGWSEACWLVTPDFSSQAERQSDSIHLGGAASCKGRKVSVSGVDNPGVTHERPTLHRILQPVSLVFPSSLPEFLTLLIGFSFFFPCLVKSKIKQFYWDFLSSFLYKLFPHVDTNPPGAVTRRLPQGGTHAGAGAACPSPLSPPGSRRQPRTMGGLGPRVQSPSSSRQAAAQHLCSDLPLPARPSAQHASQNSQVNLKHREPCRRSWQSLPRGEAPAPWQTAVGSAFLSTRTPPQEYDLTRALEQHRPAVCSQQSSASGSIWMTPHRLPR